MRTNIKGLSGFVFLKLVEHDFHFAWDFSVYSNSFCEFEKFVSTFIRFIFQAQDCPTRLIEYVKTNPLALLQLNGFIMNAQYDQLIDYGLNTVRFCINT